MIEMVGFRFTAGELNVNDVDVGDAGGWFSLLYRLLCTGLSNDDSDLLRLLILSGDDAEFVLSGWRTLFTSGTASKFNLFRAGEYGLFSLSINDDKSIKSSSIASKFDLSCDGLHGQGRGLDGGLRLLKNEVSSVISKSNLSKIKNKINFLEHFGICRNIWYKNFIEIEI